MKDVKKLLIIITCILIIICLIFVARTFSKYRTSTSGTADVNIAKWNIKINNQTIRNNTDLSAILTPNFPGTNDISANIIAPTAEGYIDLALDYTDTDVSFDYEITVEPASTSSVQDLVATGYAYGPSYTPVNDMGSQNELSGTASYSDVTKTKNIRVFLKWEDTNGTMDNAADTNATIPNNATAQMEVTVHFIQNPDTSNP